MRHSAVPDVAEPLIAVVDDDPVVRAVLTRVLQRLGSVRCVEFAAPEPLMDWLGDHEPDIIITDQDMGAMSGTELIGVVRSVPRLADVPILMVTSHDSRVVRHAALAAGASDFLSKPIDPTEVLLRTRNMLTVSASRRVLAQRAEELEEQVAQATTLLANREREIILRLSRAVEQRDEETGLHVRRIAEFSRILGAALGLPKEDTRRLWLASPLHDVGKIGVSDEILRKPGRYTPEERGLMEQHVLVGHRVLAGSGIPLLDAAAVIALHHHERWDGTGYPHRLAGTAIPRDARIVAVADVFDALTSVRPYKEAWTIPAAVEFLIHQAGQHFDPEVVSAFLASLPAISDAAEQLAEQPVPAGSEATAPPESPALGSDSDASMARMHQAS